LIECFVDCKTADGYILRVFVIAFTKRRDDQKSKTSYAKGSQIQDIRGKVNEILSGEISKLSINDVVKHFMSEHFTEKITHATRFIYPLKDVTLRKVKCLRRPKIDAVKLNDMYSHPKGSGRKEAAVVEGDGTANTLTKEVKEVKEVKE